MRLGSESPIVTAHCDYRFNASKHFIKSDINAAFLKRNNINLTVKQFKEAMKGASHQFKALYGNAHVRMGRCKVYNIYDVKQYINHKENSYERGV